MLYGVFKSAGRTHWKNLGTDDVNHARELLADEMKQEVKVGWKRFRTVTLRELPERYAGKCAIIFNTSNTETTREKTVFGDPLGAIWKNCVFSLCGVPVIHRRMFNTFVASSKAQRQGRLSEVSLSRAARAGALHAVPTGRPGFRSGSSYRIL
jgi:hypothetical protein